MPNLIFDVGQSGTRLRLMDAAVTLGEHKVQGFAYGSNLAEVVEGIVAAAAHAFGISRFDQIAGGCTGIYGRVPDFTPTAHRLAESHGVRRLLVADDGVTAHLAVFGYDPGVIAAVGTGLVALGSGPDGAARVDGVGSLIGDNGAGSWIGRAGIIAALSHLDGRAGGSPVLLDALEARYGSAVEFPRMLAADPAPIARVAAFAADVAIAARAGDAVAATIWRDAALYIATAVTAAAHRSGLRSGLRWCVTGRIADSLDLLEPFLDDSVQAESPGSTRITARVEPLHGAALLLDLPDPTTRFSSMIGEFTNERGSA